MSPVKVVGRGTTSETPTLPPRPMAVHVVGGKEGEGVYPPDRGLWEGHPGPAWPPATCKGCGRRGSEPLRVIFEMQASKGEEQAAFAAEIARAVPKGEVEWYFVTEDDEESPRTDAGLREHGETGVVSAGSGDRMFWEFLRVVLDFKPHLMHTCTWRGAQWAKKCGLPWVRVIDGKTEGSRPVEFGREEPLAAYRRLVAQPVDIIVVASGQASMTQMCVSHLLANTWWPHRLVLVDNGSEDGQEVAKVFLRAREMLGKQRCEVLTRKENLGCPGGRQVGYERCRAEWVFVLDNDMLVPPGWLGKLMATAETEPNVGAVAAWSEVYPPGVRGAVAQKQNSHIRAANNLYRRRAIIAAEEQKGQLYTEPFISHHGGSDTDLNYRIIEAGYDLYFDGQIILHHLGGSLFRMPGMTRRFAKGMDVQAAHQDLRQKWLRPGVRSQTNTKVGS